MKKLIILSILFLFCLSCSVNEKPEFLKIDNIKVLESTSNYVTLTADAYFLNPNDIGGVLKSDGIKVFVNDNEMAIVSSKSFDVPTNKEFSIPLMASVPTDSILSTKNMGSLIGSLFSQKLKVQYIGDIQYKVFGFSHRYQVDKTEDVKIKL
ncbi:Late embryogenesis abundant protein [Formosa sp. Hel1_31_208]|uniref:hypothetical protein n=1 Tax=Formosa sp. Hel1_31_208 TaxID=1798225 RepID=UPI00087D38A6|nr:hypothetical protein [Formosa sp. Hel1_31_208]SDS54610.1 Late embryogenesis abundant protein [Formosa sp. Hel1_31_208]